jgi:hypothetical protein
MNWKLGLARGAIFLISYVTINLIFISHTISRDQWLFSLLFSSIIGILNQITLEKLSAKGYSL